MTQVIRHSGSCVHVTALAAESLSRSPDGGGSALGGHPVTVAGGAGLVGALSRARSQAGVVIRVRVWVKEGESGAVNIFHSQQQRKNGHHRAAHGGSSPPSCHLVSAAVVPRGHSCSSRAENPRSESVKSCVNHRNNRLLRTQPKRERGQSTHGVGGERSLCQSSPASAACVRAWVL